MRILIIILLLSPFFTVAQQFSKIEEDLQRSFLTVERGDTIYIPSGTYKIQRTLWLADAKYVVIIGAGMNESILDFSDQIDGAEGIKVTNSTNIIMQGFTVRGAKGDGIKIQETSYIRLNDVKAEWVGKPSKKNGAYGLYPVLSKNIIIENCEAVGASDAGIYVGQSEDIIVRNNLAYYNVAGIEIENSERAEVYNNNAFGNTGGILIFDLPDLQKKRGGKVKVHDNIVAENNLVNFAPKGNIVGKVPQGTGILILATSEVEVYNNDITNNRSIGLGIVSYYMTELPITDKEYIPVSQDIYIHDNRFLRLDIRATSKGRMGKMFRHKLKFKKDVPHILWDGITREGQDFRMCLWNNKDESFANIDAENDFKNIIRSAEAFQCKGNY